MLTGWFHRLIGDFRLLRKRDWVKFIALFVGSAIAASIAGRFEFTELRYGLVFVPSMFLIMLLLLRKQEKELAEKFTKNPPAGS